MRTKIVCIQLLMMACLVSACVPLVHHGFYDPVSVPAGWKVRQFQGSTQFSDNAARASKPRWYISVFAKRKGLFYLCLATDAWDPMKLYRQSRILGTTITVTMHDQQNRQRIIDVPKSRTPGFLGAEIDVGDSEDFTITLPTFQVGDVTVDVLPLHLKWSDRRYYELSPLMK